MHAFVRWQFHLTKACKYNVSAPKTVLKFVFVDGNVEDYQTPCVERRPLTFGHHNSYDEELVALYIDEVVMRSCDHRRNVIWCR